MSQSQTGLITLVNLLDTTNQEAVEILTSNPAWCLICLDHSEYSDDVDVDDPDLTYYIAGKGLEVTQLERVEYDSLVIFKLFSEDEFPFEKSWDEILNPLGFQIFE